MNLPAMMGTDGKVLFSPPTPADLCDMAAYIKANRSATTPFDIVMEGQTPGDDPEKAAALVRPYAEAGGTWWNESMWDAQDNNTVLARIRQGPPRVG